MIQLVNQLSKSLVSVCAAADHSSSVAVQALCRSVLSLLVSVVHINKSKQLFAAQLDRACATVHIPPSRVYHLESDQHESVCPVTNNNGLLLHFDLPIQVERILAQCVIAQALQ